MRSPGGAFVVRRGERHVLGTWQRIDWVEETLMLNLKGYFRGRRLIAVGCFDVSILPARDYQGSFSSKRGIVYIFGIGVCTFLGST